MWSIVTLISQDGVRLQTYDFRKNCSPRLVVEAEVGRTDLKQWIVGKGNRSVLYDVRQQQIYE